MQGGGGGGGGGGGRGRLYIFMALSHPQIRIRANMKGSKLQTGDLMLEIFIVHQNGCRGGGKLLLCRHHNHYANTLLTRTSIPKPKMKIMNKNQLHGSKSLSLHFIPICVSMLIFVDCFHFCLGILMSAQQLANSLATATAAILVHNENLLRLCTIMAAVSMAKANTL